MKIGKFVLLLMLCSLIITISMFSALFAKAMVILLITTTVALLTRAFSDAEGYDE